MTETVGSGWATEWHDRDSGFRVGQRQWVQGGTQNGMTETVGSGWDTEWHDRDSGFRVGHRMA